MTEKQRFLACRATCYRRRSVSYRRHPMASSEANVVSAFRLPSSRGESFGDYCTKRERVRVCRFGARCTTPSCYSVANLREVGGREEARAGKNLS